jgi:hypothetical protein
VFRILTLRRSLGLVLTVVVALYVADYLYLRLRMLHPTPSDPFESMTRTRVLAIPQKNGKTDYQIDLTQPSERLTCVHSLFPHYGDRPCWYLKPRLNDAVPVSSRGLAGGSATTGYADRESSLAGAGGTKRIRL